MGMRAGCMHLALDLSVGLQQAGALLSNCCLFPLQSIAIPRAGPGRTGWV